MKKKNISPNDIVFEFLSDDPELEDAFSGKGHERSAKSLAHAITKFSNDNRSIGLEGAWGSGKTTVVSLAERELDQGHPNKFAFFTFDLWANQSVEFRRAFLEEFLHWSKSSLEPKKEEDLVKRVQGKTKTVDTTSERQFSIFGYILMASLFLLPFLVFWLSPFSANLHKSAENAIGQETIDRNLPWLFQMFHDYAHWAAIGIIAIVIISFCAQTFYLWTKKRSLRKALDGSFSLFARKSDKETVIQTIRDGDPTKYEFHNIFLEILSLTQRSGRRVIFVFDNIDRLPAEQIQETWSNVRSVFSRNSSEKKSSDLMVTAVVPYDREHILSTFTDSNAQQTEVDTQASYDRSQPYIQEDLFRKTFSAIISVAPPVTSDVESFFIICLDKALPKQFDSGQKYRLFQIFDFFLAKTSTNPTPRQVKAFVNDLGLLWNQWEGDVSVEAIAIFLLHRSVLEKEPKSLQKPDTISGRYRHFAPTVELDKELAALTYNVEPKIALEVLLERDITAAICDSNSDRLIELSNSPGFKQQLDNILSQNCSLWAKSSLEDFETALSNYLELPLDNSIKELCDRHFVNSIPQFENIDVENWESHKTLFRIVSTMHGGSLRRHLAAISKWVSESLPEKKTMKQGRAWIGFIGGFLQEIRRSHGNNTLESLTTGITIPYSPEFYLGVALDCDEVELHFNQFKNSAKFKSSEIAESIAKLGIDTPKNLSFVWGELYHYLKSKDKTMVFNQLIAQLRSNLLDEKDDREVYLQNLVCIAATSKANPDIQQDLKVALEDGSLTWHALKANESENWNSLAAALWLTSYASGTNNFPTLTTPNKTPFGDLRAAHAWFSGYYENSAADEVIRNLAKLVKLYDQVDSWLVEFSESAHHVLYKEVLSNALSDKNCPPIALQTLLEHYETLKTQFGAETSFLVIKKVGENISNDDIEDIDVSLVPPELIQDIALLQEEAWTTLLSRTDKYLKNLTSDDWKEALRSKNHNRKLLFARGNNLSGSIPPNSLRSPLIEYVVDLLTSEDISATELNGQSEFWLALSPSIRKAVSRDVFERIANRPVNPETLSVVMSEFSGLFKILPLKDDPETAISKILIPLVSNNPSAACANVEQRRSDWLNCIESTTPETKDQLIAYFSDIEEKSEKIQTALKSIQSLLKLTTPTHTQTESKDESSVTE